MCRKGEEVGAGGGGKEEEKVHMYIFLLLLIALESHFSPIVIYMHKFTIILHSSPSSLPPAPIDADMDWSLLSPKGPSIPDARLASLERSYIAERWGDLARCAWRHKLVSPAADASRRCLMWVETLDPRSERLAFLSASTSALIMGQVALVSNKRGSSKKGPTKASISLDRETLSNAVPLFLLASRLGTAMGSPQHALNPVTSLWQRLSRLASTESSKSSSKSTATATSGSDPGTGTDLRPHCITLLHLCESLQSSVSYGTSLACDVADAAVRACAQEVANPCGDIVYPGGDDNQGQSGKSSTDHKSR